jgi:hypothetical protein
MADEDVNRSEVVFGAEVNEEEFATAEAKLKQHAATAERISKESADRIAASDAQRHAAANAEQERILKEWLATEMARATATEQANARIVASTEDTARKLSAINQQVAESAKATFQTAMDPGKLEKIRRRVEGESTLYRGVKGEGEMPSDPGDLGVGPYYSTSKARAENYGRVTRQTVSLGKPLILTEQEAYEQIASRYGTVDPGISPNEGEKQADFNRGARPRT